MKEQEKKKVLGKLKLNKLSENALEKREMKVLKGGCDCVIKGDNKFYGN
ncbi:rSAM-modified peptide [Parabacteroides distasonis]|jgi:natural product precursor|nr:TIGR04149 family rSAM-modified RiPP [Parabacteroides distasonis]RGT94545.1 rSAM-modified peptide [Parabacteroides distasonis]